MKMFRVLLAVISFASIPSAQATQVSQVEISQAAASQSVQMTDQRFEPIYENQPYETTCDRQVVDHVETVCQTVTDNVCHGGEPVCTTESSQVCNSSGCTTIPRRVCSDGPQECEDVPRRECSDQNVYRTEYYSCTQYHEVQVGQRLVKSFLNNVQVSIDHPEALQGQRLVLSLAESEDSVSATLVSSFALNLLTIEQKVLSNSDTGANQVISTQIMIHVDAATALVGKILVSSLQDLALHSSSITMKIAGGADLAQSLSIAVDLTQHRAIIRDKVLANQSIDSASLSLVAQGSDLMVTIPLDKLNVSALAAKRHSLSVDITLKRPALAILNTNDLSAILNKKMSAALTDVIPN